MAFSQTVPPIYEGDLIQQNSSNSSTNDNKTRVYVVVYPSNTTATAFLPLSTQRPQGYGLGICVAPSTQKHSGINLKKFLPSSSSSSSRHRQEEEPTVFSVEDLGQHGITKRSGSRVDRVGLVARFLVGQKTEDVGLDEYEACMTSVLQQWHEGETRADTQWIKEVLRALQEQSLIASFDIDEFVRVMWVVVEERVQDPNAMPFYVKDFDYLAWLQQESVQRPVADESVDGQ